MMNRGAIDEIGRHRPRRGGREGRPHLRRHRRGVRRLPRRLRAGLRRPAASTSAATTTATTAPTYAATGPRSASTCPASRSRCSTPRSRGHTAGQVTRRAARVARRPRRRAPTGRCSCSATTTSGAPTPRERPDDYFGIHPDDSERLVAVVARHPSILGYFAGHTHRNRVRRFSATGDRAVGRGGLREGLPGHVGRVPGVRGRRAPDPPPHLHTRGPGVDREDPRTCTPASTREYAFGELGDRCFAMPASAT